MQHVKRLLYALKKHGDKAVVHGRRGNSAWLARRTPKSRMLNSPAQLEYLLPAGFRRLFEVSANGIKLKRLKLAS